MKLEVAQKILAATLASARSQHVQPLAVAVLDARGALGPLAAEDGDQPEAQPTSPSAKRTGRWPWGSGRAPCSTRRAAAHFIAAVTHAVGGSLIPVPGGVLIRDAGHAARCGRRVRRQLRQR